MYALRFCLWRERLRLARKAMPQVPGWRRRYKILGTSKPSRFLGLDYPDGCAFGDIHECDPFKVPSFSGGSGERERLRLLRPIKVPLTSSRGWPVGRFSGLRVAEIASSTVVAATQMVRMSARVSEMHKKPGCPGSHRALLLSRASRPVEACVMSIFGAAASFWDGTF